MEHITGSIIRGMEYVGELPLLLAIRRGLAMTLPLIIAGSLSLLLLHIPLPSLQIFLDDVLGDNWRALCQLIEQGSFGIASLAVFISIVFAYAREKANLANGVGLNPGVTIVVCLSAYFVAATPLDGNIFKGFFSLGSGGFPIALCIAITSAPLFLFLMRFNPFKTFLNSAGGDSDINESLAAIPAGIATIFIFGLVRLFLNQAGFADLHHQAQLLFGTPFQGAYNNLRTGLEYVALSQSLWFFGLHGPNLLFLVEKEIFAPASLVNIHAISLGLEPIFIITKPFLDTFVHIGGSGSTLALILAILLRSKVVSNRRLALIAILPALFNVNEVILFGLPLVLNPIYAIPFLLAPAVQTVVAYWATVLHWVPMTVNDIHWTTPLGFGGYAATGAMSGAALQVICMLAGTLIYLPFVELGNILNARRFNRSMNILMTTAGTVDHKPSKRCLDLPGQEGMLAKALAGDLARTLDSDDQIYLVYQPQIDADNGKVVGAEALLRWKHPVYGLIPPHVAVALAEDADLIGRLGLRILLDACTQHAVLLQKGVSDCVLSVNMSVAQFEDKRLVEKIVAILEKTGLEPTMLKVEVTESIVLTPDATSVSILCDLRAIGIRVAIDDFGMGHTSLRYLREFPVDTVKIDRCFTQESSDGVNDYIIASIVQLCEAMKIQVIVEGVETEAQLERFRAHRCSIFQGYLFSKPLSGEAYVDFLCQKQVVVPRISDC